MFPRAVNMSHIAAICHVAIGMLHTAAICRNASHRYVTYCWNMCYRSRLDMSHTAAICHITVDTSHTAATSHIAVDMSLLLQYVKSL